MKQVLIIFAAILVTACTTTGNDPATLSLRAMTNQEFLAVYVDQGDAGDIQDHEIVCRVETPTGTRLRRPICRTHAEWQEMRREGQRLFEHRQTGSATTY